MSLSKIYEGWKNHLFPPDYMKEQIEKVSNDRLAICRQCPFNSENDVNYKSFRTDEHCIKCGCTLVAKSKCMSCACPENKWLAVLTPEEEKTIDDETNV